MVGCIRCSSCCCCCAGKVQDEEQYGPTANRSCTDVFFLLLFIAFWAGMIVVAIKAFEYGDVRRLVLESDANIYAFAG